MTLLSVETLGKEFGGLIALDDVTFGVDRGEVVGMIGPNGAGKTTLFNCIAGNLDPERGTVRFDGTDVTGAEPHEHARNGLVRTYQQARELSTMTVADNMLLPALDHPGERAHHAILRTAAATERERGVEVTAQELLEFFELDHMADEYAGGLSGGQRKLLEFARALVLEPDLLLLDEPFAGVNPTLTTRITEYVTRLNEQGMTFLIIEHDIGTLAELVDRLIVLSDGQVLLSGDPGDVLQDERVIDTYLGEPTEP